MGAVLVFHDISELRRLEHIRKDFVANVSHELRTPITSIRGYAETLLDGALDDTQHARHFVKIILDESNRLSRLISDLLDLSCIEEGKINGEFKKCSLQNILFQVLTSLRSSLDASQITIENYIKDTFFVRADESQIMQVFYNLLDNAVKYNTSPGKVVISAQEDDTMVKISIQDTGVGIPRKDLPRIFERFYRVDKARSRQLGGTGLGLAIVKHLIHAHGGEVEVESVVGKGSTFSFYASEGSLN